jgi:flagellar biogenesis protein FliO
LWLFAPSLFFVHGRNVDKVVPMNAEQLQSLAVLALAMALVVLLWWVLIRMLD